MSVKHDITEENLRLNSFRVLHAGDDYDYRFVISEGSSVMDLTGAKVWFTMKESTLESDAAAKLQLTSDDTDEVEIVAPATDGVIIIKFKSSGAKSTENLEGIWDYDVQILTASNRVMTVAAGKIEFLPNLTRSIA
jgi:hypothetical protein